MPRGQPQLQVLCRLPLLLSIAMQQVPSQVLHQRSPLQLLLKQQGLPRLQGLPPLQAPILLDLLLRLLSLGLLLQGFKLLATQ